jgi:hydrogenase maturation protease
MMVAPRILIAGVGNIFLGDDAFGVEVAAELSRRWLPDCVRVVDFGIRGLDLAYTLLDGYETVILVDAVPRGGAPGQVYVIETDVAATATSGGPLIETHRMDPARVLQLVSTMGGQIKRLLVVGCEPVPLDDFEDIQPGLSGSAEAAVPVAVREIVRLIDEILTAPKEHPHEMANYRR